MGLIAVTTTRAEYNPGEQPEIGLGHDSTTACNDAGLRAHSGGEKGRMRNGHSL